MDIHMSRRHFNKLAVVATATLASAGSSSILTASPNNKVIIAVAGIHSRGLYLAKVFTKIKNVEVRYVIDVDSRFLPKAAKSVTDQQGKEPLAVMDFRRALDDKDVDALVVATPDHWHAPMAIEALKAGKHVYLEKPCSHNPAEGELLVAAQIKYNKIVQMGTQRRSSWVAQNMVREIKAGLIGNVYSAQTWYSRKRGPIGFGKKVAVPEYFNWDLWQGPAPRVDYRDNIHPYNWHWFFNWGTGEALNNGAHEIDVARWAMGVDFPSKVSSSGGRYNFVGQDDWEFYDTQNIAIEFAENKMITWQGRSCSNCQIEGQGRGVRLHGTEGTVIYLDSHYDVYDKDFKKVKTVSDPTADKAQDSKDSTNTVDPGVQENHGENFIDAVRGECKNNATIDEGHKSVLLGLLGNISQRVGRSLRCDPKTGRILNDAEAMKLWSREYESGWEPRI
jgi:predicted dehydrogenase